LDTTAFFGVPILGTHGIITAVLYDTGR